MKFLFGPVPSRRFGRSLGIDLFPLKKTCTFNCIYCEVGTGAPVKDFADFDYLPILRELEGFLIDNHDDLPDFITFAGSGEPTLFKKLGELIKGIKSLTDIPVVVLTNGSLFFDKEVRKNCLNCDYLVPSLDAGSEKVFLKINRPHRFFSDYNRYLKGLIEMRKDFPGHFLLEVLLVDGVNTHIEELILLKEKIDLINPDKVQINSVFRPPAERFAKPVGDEIVEKFRKIIGDKAEPVKYYQKNGKSLKVLKGDLLEKVILKTVKIRPCTVSELADSLGVSYALLEREILGLIKQGKIELFDFQGEKHLKVKS